MKLNREDGLSSGTSALLSSHSEQGQVSRWTCKSLQAFAMDAVPLKAHTTVVLFHAINIFVSLAFSLRHQCPVSPAA